MMKSIIKWIIKEFAGGFVVWLKGGSEMKDKLGIIAVVLASISLILSLFAFTARSAAPAPSEETTQYVMYIGTNDKDTYKPEHTQEEAKQIVDEICLKNFDGYTLQEATGSWTDEKNNVTHEYTIVCYFDDADEEVVYKTADEIIEALNQNTVLIERDDIRTEYYSGKKQ